MFEICLHKFREQLSNLQYVIFDLYDYNVYNIDVSVTADFFNYLASGGVLEPHNYSQSRVYKNGFKRDIYERLNIMMEISPQINEVMEELFEDNIGLNAEIEGTIKRINSIKRMEPLSAEKCFSGIVTKRYEDTIRENKKTLELFCQNVKKFNSSTKIIFTLLPRYITMEKIMQPFMKEWKKEFECFIEELHTKYDAIYLNYKDREDISDNNYFYWDVNHLNAAGGISMTSIIDEYIKNNIND